MSNPTEIKKPTNTQRTQPVSSSRSEISAYREVPDIKQADFEKWIQQLYTTVITEEELKQMYQTIAYKGFNRDDILKHLMKLGVDGKLLIELIVLCSLQGPQRASKTTMSNGKTPIQMGIPASGGQGSKALTCNRISAATADLAAYYLKRLNAPKRLNIDLPGWLQFPSAGSIRLIPRYREAHIEFSKTFSKQIGGEFNEQIYNQMMLNAYLDESLRLFD
jgi:hypothetical protein